jgi:hypothetical protein
MFEVFLALDGRKSGIVLLEIDQRFHPISRGEAFDESRAMLMDAPDKIARDPDIQGSPRLTRQDVDPKGHHLSCAATASHPSSDAAIPKKMDGRVKPGHDGG